MLLCCRESSLQEHLLLRSSWTEGVNGQFGLKIRNEGYSWFCQQHQDRKFIKINRIGDFKTLLKDVDTLWVIPSSNTKKSKDNEGKISFKGEENVILSFVDSENLILSIDRKRTLMR